ncbi:unnamed protein product [Heterobilharzia americana]|nr:unnamed protein product [Heterobilharzia americana]
MKDIGKALVNIGLDYIIRLDEWLDKNIGKQELKAMKEHVIKFSQLAINFIDTTFESILSENGTKKEKQQTKHSEL